MDLDRSEFPSKVAKEPPFLVVGTLICPGVKWI